MFAFHLSTTDVSSFRRAPSAKECVVRSAAFSSPPHDSRRSVPMATRLPILTPGMMAPRPPRDSRQLSEFQNGQRAWLAPGYPPTPWTVLEPAAGGYPPTPHAGPPTIPTPQNNEILRPVINERLMENRRW